MATIVSSRRQRSTIRLALPSKGRMEDETVELLKSCGLSVNKVNPRQYIASISQIPHLQVWFQRSADVVRKVRDGDTDLGIVGYDKAAEYCGSGVLVLPITYIFEEEPARWQALLQKLRLAETVI